MAQYGHIFDTFPPREQSVAEQLSNPQHRAAFILFSLFRVFSFEIFPLFVVLVRHVHNQCRLSVHVVIPTRASVKRGCKASWAMALIGCLSIFFIIYMALIGRR